MDMDMEELARTFGSSTEYDAPAGEYGYTLPAPGSGNVAPLNPIPMTHPLPGSLTQEDATRIKEMEVMGFMDDLIAVSKASADNAAAATDTTINSIKGRRPWTSATVVCGQQEGFRPRRCYTFWYYSKNTIALYGKRVS